MEREGERGWGFLNGGGEMAGRIMRHGWRETALGGPQAWPQALKTLVTVMLGSNEPMFVAWGPQRTLLYNDAYAEVLAGKHPALGQDLLEVWREIRTDLGPLVAKAYRGEPSRMDDIQLVMERKGYREVTHWSYSYTPIHDDGGAIGGFFCTCHEVTGLVQAQRAEAFRLALEERLGAQREPEGAVAAASELLGRHLGANRVGYAEVQADDATVVLRSCFVDGLEPLSGPVRLEAFGAQGVAGLREGRTQVSGDAGGRPAREAGGDAQAFASAPLVREGRLTTWFFVHFREPHAWTSDEIGLVEEVAARTWSAMERARSGALLRESERRLRALVTAGSYSIYRMSPDWQEMRQLDGRGFIADTAAPSVRWLDVYIDPADRPEVLATIAEAVRETKTFELEHRVRRADGGFGWTLSRAVPILDDAGEVVEWFGAASDVTDRRAAETTLRDQEEQLRLATEAAEIGLWDLDPTSDTLFWPPRVKAMFGISPHRPISMADFYAGLHAEDRDRVAAAFAAACDPARRALYDVEYRTVGREDGRVRWVAAKGRAQFDAEGVCIRVTGTAIDITARRQEAEKLKASEAALSESAALLDASIGYAPIGFAFFDRERRYVRVNDTLAAINGVPAADHVGRTAADIVPANAEAVDRVLDQVFATGEPAPAVEIEGQTPATLGGMRTWLTSFFPVFGADRETRFVGVTVIDITERKRAEDRVASLNATLERRVAVASAERDAAWSNARDLLAVSDGEGVLQAVNPAWTHVLGWTADELIGRSALDFVLPEDRQATLAALADAAVGVLPVVENRYRHKDGSHRWISWLAAPQGAQIYANGRDVTAEKAREAELEAAQDALRQAQKMDAVGQLTGGIAHDFNNLLQGVAGSLDLIRRRPEDVARVRRWAEAGLMAAERGAKLTGQLLAFSRAQRLDAKPLLASALIESMRELLERTLGPAVRIGFDLDAACPPVLADATQLEMAVLNLAINARDAMPEGGELTISTRLRTLDRDLELAPGDYVELAVADTGSGMAPEVVARAFDPFFTTKEVGKGTGLGLSQVYGIARSAGGAARIDSGPGRGTTVSLFLRRTDQPVRTAAGTGGGEAAPAVAACVLVVDDDADVRRFLHDSLEALGFAVELAANGEEGLTALENGRHDVVLLDYAMPGLNGSEVYRKARARRPDVPIIFASGYSDTQAIEQAAGKDAPVLRKPFRIDELQAAIGQALRSRP